VVHHTLRAGDVPAGVYQDLAEHARKRWPTPWRDAILDCIGRRAVIGTPIAEYLPNRLARGRLALVGDAAHVPTPMTGKGFGASLQDALALADAASDGVRGSAGQEALCRYEQQRLQPGEGRAAVQPLVCAVHRLTRPGSRHVNARDIYRTSSQHNRSFGPASGHSPPAGARMRFVS
jgi:2-polyprenyl-6-methoxyphenol hydroxylase-like FAD-dependent oxidoreductase